MLIALIVALSLVPILQLMFQRILLAWDGSRGRAARVRRRHRRHPPLRRRARRRLVAYSPAHAETAADRERVRRRRPPLPHRDLREVADRAAPRRRRRRARDHRGRHPGPGAARLRARARLRSDRLRTPPQPPRRPAAAARRHPGAARQRHPCRVMRRQRRDAMTEDVLRRRRRASVTSPMARVTVESSRRSSPAARSARCCASGSASTSRPRRQTGRGRRSRSTSPARSRSAYFATRLQERLPQSTYRRPLLGTGFCGAYTTFSTMQVEILKMLDAHRYGLAAGYALGEHRRRLCRDLGRDRDRRDARG